MSFFFWKERPINQPKIKEPVLLLFNWLSSRYKPPKDVHIGYI